MANIAIDSNSTLTISCGLFQLRACKQSSLRITGGGYSERFCKRRSKLTKTIDDNNMKVYFRTSSSQMRRKGFSCTVTASGNCGTVNRVSRIVGGVETEVNEYPWQAVFVHNGTNDVICGAVLLTDQLVETTQSCILKINGSAVDVLLGAHDLNNPTEFQQRVPVQRLPSLFGFNETTQDNDNIGVDINSVNINDRVKPICLPDPTKDYSGRVAVTTGWGSLAEGMEIEMKMFL
ncbi:serine protease 33-like [Palaemon carinicauda]|uniref:serine protease 33-like n=1 Tax=Palaemon carinicauda TaxID=392227 RepID=UPI0035B5E7C4